MWGARDAHPLLLGANGTDTSETALQVLTEMSVLSSRDPQSRSLLLTQRGRSRVCTNTSTRTSAAASTPRGQSLGATEMPFSRWRINKLLYVHTTEYHSSTNRNKQRAVRIT